jgi:hypothetical protein
MPNTTSNERRGVVPLARLLLTGVLAVTVLAGCATGSNGGAPDAAAPTAAANHFGPDGFGKLKLTMTEQEALATGDLGAAPIADDGCKDYSFMGGPSPDPSRMAADAKIEKEYRDAQKAAEKARGKADKKLGANASAQEYADSAQGFADSAAAEAKAAEASAASAERAAARTEAFTKAGGASFGSGKLRVLVAPPQAKTAAGIARGATVAQLKAAYEAQGLKSTSEGRYEMPAAGQPGWSFAFDVTGDKVAYFLLLNSGIRCA